MSFYLANTADCHHLEAACIYFHNHGNNLGIGMALFCVCTSISALVMLCKGSIILGRFCSFKFTLFSDKHVFAVSLNDMKFIGNFWHFLKFLTFFENFDFFWKFWLFLKLFEIFWLFLKFLTFFVMFDFFWNFWLFLKFLTFFWNFWLFLKFLTFFEIFGSPWN